MKKSKFTKFIIFILILFNCNIVLSSDWTEWREISNQSLPLKIDNISDIIGQSEFSGWISEANFQGGKAKNYWIENYFTKGFILIDYLKFPPTWVIRDSGNDKKYIISKVGYLLNLDRRNNPIKNISKKDIERYRDVENNVVPHVFFQFENQECLIINKGYYKRETGYIRSVEDDETLSILFCKNSGIINSNTAQILIDSIQIK